MVFGIIAFVEKDFWKPLTNKPFEEIVVAWIDQFAVFDNQFKLVKKLVF